MGICVVLWQHDRSKWKEKSQHHRTRLLSGGQCGNTTWGIQFHSKLYPLTLTKTFFGFFCMHPLLLTPWYLCTHLFIHSSSLSVQDGGAGRYSVSGGWVMECGPDQLLQCQGLHLSHHVLLQGQCDGNWGGALWSHCLWGCPKVKLKYKHTAQASLTKCHRTRLI